MCATHRIINIYTHLGWTYAYVWYYRLFSMVVNGKLLGSETSLQWSLKELQHLEFASDSGAEKVGARLCGGVQMKAGA